MHLSLIDCFLTSIMLYLAILDGMCAGSEVGFPVVPGAAVFVWFLDF